MNLSKAMNLLHDLGYGIHDFSLLTRFRLGLPEAARTVLEEFWITHEALATALEEKEALAGRLQAIQELLEQERGGRDEDC